MVLSSRHIFQSVSQLASQVSQAYLVRAPIFLFPTRPKNYRAGKVLTTIDAPPACLAPRASSPVLILRSVCRS